jgi:hypothetical protein
MRNIFQPGYGYLIMSILTIWLLSGGTLAVWLPLLPLSARTKDIIRYVAIVLVVLLTVAMLQRFNSPLTIHRGGD